MFVPTLRLRTMRLRAVLLLLSFLLAMTRPMVAAESRLHLSDTRASSGDLEIGGELTGLPAGSTRYVRYEDLLALPQESYTVSDDMNFHDKTEISGVALTTLAQMLGQKDHSDLIVAICYDKYRSNYSSDYLKAHHPILVLKINGQERERWPKSEYGGSLGPYLISHPAFHPSFKVLSHEDEAQIPFGVTRIEFRSEATVLGAIKPRGNWAKGTQDTKGRMVWQGYRIASQDCYRCHSMQGEGGEKAQRSWLILGAWAATDATNFQKYIRNPKSVMPCAQMPEHAHYDSATLEALTAYFATFAYTGKKR
jgi:cytochrome c2